jgi:predicted esterase
MHHVRTAIEQAVPDADLLFPDYPAGMFSTADPVDITEALGDCIADAVRLRASRGGAYREIILVGHSLGALLVRKAYAFAMGQNQDHSGTSSLRPAAQQWAGLVTRIILMAGTNRGWSLRNKARGLSWLKWCGFVFGAWLWRWFRLGGLINRVREGAPFVTNLRIQWINLVRDPVLSKQVPLTIQLLGTIDDIVDERDNVDVQAGARFIYKAVPDTGHVNVIDFSGSAGGRRRSIFLDALTTGADRLASDRTVPFEPNPDVQHVVFLVHGIRDFGFWTSRLSAAVRAEGSRRGARVETVTSDYGYFPMINFLFQPERQKNVRWFMDQYTEARARYPSATISFIGHSNGTYLLASALQRYKACTFHRAVFAGSVVNRNFDWPQYVAQRRINAVQNYVATADIVVAIFPAVFEHLRRTKADLGSAGHTGFARRDPPVYQVTYVTGGHGAALDPRNFDALAAFVLGDDTARPGEALRADAQSRAVVWFGKFCLPVFVGLLLIALLPLWVFLAAYFGRIPWPGDWLPIASTAWFVAIYVGVRLA